MAVHSADNNENMYLINRQTNIQAFIDTNRKTTRQQNPQTNKHLKKNTPPQNIGLHAEENEEKARQGLREKRFDPKTKTHRKHTEE